VSQFVRVREQLLLALSASEDDGLLVGAGAQRAAGRRRSRRGLLGLLELSLRLGGGGGQSVDVGAHEHVVQLVDLLVVGRAGLGLAALAALRLAALSGLAVVAELAPVLRGLLRSLDRSGT
jgi:hypothetical protein